MAAEVEVSQTSVPPQAVSLAPDTKTDLKPLTAIEAWLKTFDGVSQADQTPVEDLLDSLPVAFSASPELQCWLRRRGSDGRLETYLDTLVSLREVGSREEGVGWLIDEDARNPYQPGRLTRADLNGFDHSRPWNNLDLALGRREKRPNSYRKHGVISHSAMPLLIAGRLHSYSVEGQEPQSLGQLVFPGFAKKWHQYDLFSSLINPEAWSRKQLLDTSLPVEVAADGFVNQALVRSMEECAADITASLQDGRLLEADWLTRRLYAWFLPITSPKIAGLYEPADPLNSILAMYTLRSWIQALKAFQGQDRVIFAEVKALESNSVVGGWRIDGVEITSVRGRPPTKETLCQFAQISPLSVGHLMRSVVGLAGDDVEGKIYDWKWKVGDGKGIDAMIPRVDIEQHPYSVDRRQVKEYATASSVSEALVRLGHRHAPLPFDQTTLRSSQVVYFDESGFLVHPVPVPPDDQKQIFEESVLYTLDRAWAEAAVRDRDNLLVGQVIHLIKGRKGKHARRQVAVLGAEGPQEAQAQDPLRRILQEYREMGAVDEKGIVIRVGYKADGEPRYFVRLDRLLGWLDSEDPDAKKDSRFNYTTGGFVTCPMHQVRTKDAKKDVHPSAYVYLGNGSIHCYSCGFNAFFDRDSIPADLKDRVNVSREGNYSHEIEVPFITDRHRLLMSLTHQALSEFFKRGGEGRRYLEARGLDARLADDLGVGFGDNRVVVKLLEAGFSLDELQRYDLIGFSPNVKPEWGLPLLLRKMGMADEEMQRGVRRSVAEMLLGFPYFKLGRRLTFPYHIINGDGEVIPVNVAGRLVKEVPEKDAHLKHYTLSGRDSGGVKGIFNAKALLSPGESIALTEGPPDAMALMLLFRLMSQYEPTDNIRSVAAIGGTSNDLALKMVADAAVKGGKRVLVALDFDGPGREKALVVADRLVAMGVPRKRVSDFSQTFMDSYPRGRRVKDFNDFLLWYQGSGRKYLSLS